MEYFLLAVILIAFLYFGYKDDFKRDKENSTFSIIMVILMVVAFIIISKFNSIVAFLISGMIGSIGPKFKKPILGYIFRSKQN